MNPSKSHGALRALDLPSPMVYLCGPDVFRPTERSLRQSLIALCALHGLKAIAPLDGASDLSVLPTDQRAAAVRNTCLSNIRRCRAMLVEMTPYRGVHMDPGSCVEIGYADARGMPMAGFGSAGELKYRVAREAMSPKPVDEQGDEVEDFGHPENVMVTCALSGGWHVEAQSAVAALCDQICAHPHASALERERFDIVTARIEREAAKFAGMNKFVDHPLHLEVEALGSAAVGLLLEKIARRPSHWVYSLESMARSSPVPDQNRDSMFKLVDGWLHWAEMNRLIDLSSPAPTISSMRP